MIFDPQEIDLHGLIDMHIHTSPDINIRSMDDLQAARDAVDAGMSAVVFKSHVTITADRATIAEKVVQGARVFGGIVLNDAVGGINPSAVEAAIKLGARVIWMPTFSANNHIVKNGGNKKGLSVLTDEGKIQPEIYDIFDLMKQKQPVLATCHLSVPEILILVREALKTGLTNIVITHPEAPFVDMPTNIQKELSNSGIHFERCYVSTFPIAGNVPLERIVQDIREVGIESTVIASDFGVASLPSAVQGMKAYISVLLSNGFSKRDISIMAGENPAKLLNLVR
jgi:hypothetical protein